MSLCPSRAGGPEDFLEKAALDLGPAFLWAFHLKAGSPLEVAG